MEALSWICLWMVSLTLMGAGCHGYNKTLYAAVEMENNLLKKLFDGYDKRVRPAMKHTESIQTSFGLGLKYLLQLDEREERMELLTYMLTAWHDGRLAWNSSQYMGLELLRVPASQIWRPDFMPFTSTDEDVNIMDTMAIIHAWGHVSWVPTLRLRSPCKVNLKQFPFDRQSCSVVFSSYVYHGEHLNMTYYGGSAETAVDKTDLMPNVQWELLDARAKVNRVVYECCPEPYPHMEVTLVFRRNSDFYVHVFVLPALLLGLLVPVTLLLPPEAKERVTLGAVLILGTILLMVKLSDVLPAAHSQLPALTMYYSLTMLWCVLSIMCSVFVLNLYHRGPRRGKVPDTVRWIFLRSLKRLVCLGSDSYYPLSDMDAISMRGLDKALATSQDRQAGPAGDRSGAATSKLEKDVEEVTKTMGLYSARTSVQDARNDVTSEWRQVALVLDRVLFFFFMLIFLMCSVVLLA